MNKTKAIVLFISIAVMIPLLANLMLINQPSVQVLKIELTNKPDNHVQNTEIYNKLVALEHRFNDPSLIELFDSERNKYNFILALVAVILSIFGLYTVVIRLVEKSDYENLKKDYSIIKEENIELNKLLAVGYIRAELIQLNTAFENSSTLVFRDTGVRVSNKTEFSLYLESQYTKLFIILKKANALDKEHFDEIAIPFANSIRHAIDYANTSGYTSNTSIQRSNNDIIDKILALISLILGNDKKIIFRDSIQQNCTHLPEDIYN